ncbi:DUF2919 domain-containing protein [Shewanella surugensis]|uniref:DUF2919 domain-containing protein n=1 Tax=Shewanella surugensis TaxID=212020 RepID=A0ABT0L6C8_9GAMM|nr:DUF2919 domain-containing protein [Shewanella surugensis]MCL1123244.1 DUF2919 domain-containing protein [Shewanella surugensis]
MNFSHIRWLDEKGHIKPPIYLYGMLIFIARGWCIWIASLTQASDRAGLVTLIYPQKADFIMSLIAGLGAVLIYFLVIAERKRKPEWLRGLFCQIKVLLLGLLILDGGLLIARVMSAHYLYSWSIGLDGLFLFWSGLYLFKSKRLSHYLSDWKVS